MAHHPLRASPRPTPLLDRARAWLADRRLVGWLVVAATIVSLPALGNGLAIDDWWHRLVLTRDAGEGLPLPPPIAMFSFFDGDPARTMLAVDRGMGSWWAAPGLRASFFRPLTALTHIADYALWPDAPWAMHLHSLGWYALCVALAGALYRRVLPTPWIAGLAALMWAFDPTHGLPVGWVANRNTMLSTAFALGALLLHDRGRRAGSWVATVAAPIVLGLGLLSSESALAAVGYLVAHALFLDEGPRRARGLAMVPYLAVVGAWALVYRRHHFGAHGSGMYFDPVGEPARFARAALTRLPLLLSGELGTIPPDLYPFVGPALAAAMMIAACGSVLLLVLALAPLLARDRTARFFAAGALLAAIPTCAVTASNRLLFLVGFGVLGLVAQLIARVLEADADPVAVGVARSRVVRGWVGWLVAVHVLFAPLLLAISTMQMRTVQKVVDHYADSLPTDAAITGQRLVIVNPPDAAFMGYLGLMRSIHGLPAPRRSLALAPGTRPLSITRADASTLIVRGATGFIHNDLDGLCRDPRDPMPVGTRVALTGVTVEVLATTADAGPSAAAFHFDRPLEDAAVRWMRWEGERLVPFALPAVGETVDLAAQTLSL